MRWLTSDLHLGHTNIIAFCNRPYDSVDAMNNDLVERWNGRIAADDDVWVLGDVAMGKLDESLAYVELLNGNKHLVPGNHDRMFGCVGTKYAVTAQRYVDAGFVDILEPAIGLQIGERNVMVTHFPYAGDSRDQYDDRYIDCRPEDMGHYLVHGHTHGLWRRNGRMIDVGVDAWGGYPVSFDEVDDLFSSDRVDAVPIPWK
jgi:calcineurin-like phosphoesterase family protein